MKKPFLFGFAVCLVLLGCIAATTNTTLLDFSHRIPNTVTNDAIFTGALDFKGQLTIEEAPIFLDTVNLGDFQGDFGHITDSLTNDTSNAAVDFEQSTFHGAWHLDSIPSIAGSFNGIATNITSLIISNGLVVGITH